MIEASSSAYPGGLLRLEKVTREREGDLKAILHQSAQVLLRDRPACPLHVRLRRESRGRYPAPPKHARRSSDLSLITYYDALRKDLEPLLKTAKHHDAQTLSLLQTVPGIGKILRLVLLYEMHRIERFPRVQDFATYCRLVKCRKESGGNAWAPQARKLVMRPSHGPFTRPRSSRLPFV